MKFSKIVLFTYLFSMAHFAFAGIDEDLYNAINNSDEVSLEKLLVVDMIDVNQMYKKPKSQSEFLPLDLALHIKPYSLNIIDLLLRHKADMYLLDGYGNNPLQYRIEHEKDEKNILKLLELFISHGLDVNKALQPIERGDEPRYPISLIAYRGFFHAYELLLKNGANIINELGEPIDNVLHYAVEGKSLKIVKDLISIQGLPVDSPFIMERLGLIDKKYEKYNITLTPFYVAASTKNNHKVFDYLLSQNSDVNTVLKAFPKRDYGPISADLPSYRYKINQPLISSACSLGELSYVRKLIQNGANFKFIYSEEKHYQYRTIINDCLDYEVETFRQDNKNILEVESELISLVTYFINYFKQDPDFRYYEYTGAISEDDTIHFKLNDISGGYKSLQYIFNIFKILYSSGYDSSEKHIIELFKHKRLAGTFVPNLDELVFLDKILKLFKSTGINLSQVKDRGLDLISLMTIRFADSQMIGSTLKYSYDELLNVFIKNGLVINMEALYNSMSKNGLGDSGSICNGVRTPQTLIYLIENNYLQPNNSEGRDSYYPLSKCITDIPFTELKESNIESFKQLIQTMKDYEFEIININDPYSNILTELFYNKNLYQFVRNYASTPFVMGESHFKDLIETSMMSEEEKLQILADEIYIYNNEHLKILAEIDRADLFELVFNKIFSAATPANYQNDLAYYFFENNYIDSLSKVLDLERKFIQNGHKFNSSMHYAVTKNNLDFIKYLLNAGFIIDLLNQSELTPLENLFLNTSRPDFKLVRFLLDQGARTSFIDENGNNLIQLSILNENSSSYVSVTTETLVDKLIGESLDINYKNNKGESIFIMFSQKPTIDRQFLLKLLSLNANVNLSDNKGNTIIHYLASKDTKYTSYNKLIQTIVSTYKVDLKKVNNDGFTALEIAIKNENFELAKILLDARGD